MAKSSKHCLNYDLGDSRIVLVKVQVLPCVQENAGC